MLSGLLQLRHRLLQAHCRLLDQVLTRELFRTQNAHQYEQLTSREIEVLKLLGAGFNNPGIAKKLKISRSTVETHRKHLKRKLDIKSHGKLVKYALAFDLVGY